jgi:hypothetical protein
MHTVLNSQTQYRHTLYNSACPASVQFESVSNGIKMFIILIYVIKVLIYLYTYICNVNIYGGTDRIELAQSREKWRALLNAAMNLRAP